MAGGIKGITVKIGGDTTELGRSLSNATKQSTALQKELKGVNTLLKFDPKNVTLLAQKSDLLKNSIGETEIKLKFLKEVLAKADSGEIKLTEEEYRNLQREIASTENKLKGLKEAQKEFGSVGAQQIAQVGQELEKVGGKVEAVGKKFSVISGATGAVLGGSVALASNFQDAMAKVNTIADTSAVSLDDLSAQIIDLSNQTGISANDIADATYNAISAGQSTADAVNFVSNATSLAKAGFTDTASAIDVLTTIMNAYGLEADKVGSVSDMLINTQNKGKTTVAELASSMGKIIPTANSMGVGLEQITAGYAIMTAKGIATAESTTYMNSMLNELGKSSTKVGQALKEETGKSFQELIGEGKSVGDVLQIVKDHADKSGVSFNELWQSSEAGKAGLTLLSDGAESFNAMAKDMIASTGATGEAMGKLDTPSKKAKVAINELKNAGITLGQTALSALAPLIEKVSKSVEKLTTWFSNLSPGIQQIILIVLALITALGPVLIITGKLISAVGTIMTLAPKISTAITAIKTGVMALKATLLANRIGLIIAGIAALVAGLIYAYNHCETFRNVVNGAFEKVKEVVGNVVQALVGFFTETLPNAIQALKDKITPILEGIKTVFETIWNTIKTVISTVVENIKTILLVGFTLIMNLIVPIINAFLTLFQTVWNGIKDAITAVIDFVQPYIITAWNTISGVISTVLNAIWTIITTVWNAISSVTSTIWNGITSGISTAINAVSSVITTVVNTIRNTITSVWNGIKAVTTTVWNGIKHAIINPIQSAWDTVKGVVDKIKEKVKNIFKGIVPKLHISLPHISVNGGEAPFGIGGKGHLPSFSVKWNKLGAIFNKPTIFSTDQGFQGVGEAGPEAVAPINVLQKYVAEAVDNRNINLERKLDQVIGLMANYYPDALKAMDRPVVVGVDSVDSALSDKNSKVSRGW
nr:MAG TPA: minor tail protein [Caudoviricetes sp.]